MGPATGPGQEPYGCILNELQPGHNRVTEALCEIWRPPRSEPLTHYPPYPPKLLKQWDLSVPEGYQIQLTLTHLDIRASTGCYHDALTLISNMVFHKVTIPERKTMKLCGRKSPGLIATNSNTVRLDYHIGQAGLSHGWSLGYSTQRVKCPFPSGVANGNVTPVLTEYFYRDYIDVHCDPGYKLMMDGREITSYSAMCQSNRQWHLSLPECKIIDCGEPEPLLNGGVTFISGSENQYRSVIQYHCNEPFYSLLGGVNVSYTCAADRKWRDNHDVPVTPTCIPVCGKPTKLISGYQRIIGGSAAPENTIPWQVFLSVDGSRAGGMVIGDRWVMTAASNLVHYGKTVENDTVYMGSNEVNELLKASPADVASVHVHPKYNNSNQLDYNNDIALIKLQHPIRFHASIMPICLPAEGVTYSTGVMGLVSGFGLTIEGKREVLSNNLKHIRLPVVDQAICSTSINEVKKTENHVPSLSDNMFCAGVPEAGKDSCQGDSGSAFALRDDGRFWAAGIVSWGVDCGQPGRYGVYTRVANYLDWINKTMQEN
ncbi:complement C1r-A subcomponent-like [Centroberyx affinis]|uniref:complement C1r-A subcomponent-like n=1 Tax=Centroberyx affinis TaxID=166261 RepID=UPI003A5BAC53